jgi:hypothetical protein
MKKQILKQTKRILIVGLMATFFLIVRSQSNVSAYIDQPTVYEGGNAGVHTTINENYTGESYCYDSQTEQTYQCGPNTVCGSGLSCSTAACDDSTCLSASVGAILSNEISSDYVVEPPNYNLSNSKTVSIYGTDYFLFKMDSCYVYDNPPSGPDAGIIAWVGGPCTSSNVNLTAIPDPSQITTTIFDIILKFSQSSRADASNQVLTIPDQQTPNTSGNEGGSTCASHNVNQAVNTQGQNCSLVDTFINPLIVFLSALVGIVVTASIIIGGIQYSAAGDNPQAVAAARKRIFNAVLALLIYGLLYGFLNFIIPGGIG